MTIQEALSLVDEMKDNMMKPETKIRFLNEVEQKVHREIIMTHRHTTEQEKLPEYNAETDLGTVLLVPDRYAMLYVYYIMSKIDQRNQEEDKEYNNRIRFENTWGEYQDDYNRHNMPLTARPYFVF